jgi:dimethylamine/trimethylamine dehydrogenase
MYLGGQLRLWAKLPGRELVETVAEWYRAELERLGVDVRLGSTVTADAVRTLEPHVVIVATGSHYDKTGMSGYLSAPIRGWERDLVLTPEAILVNGEQPTGTIVILDDEGQNTGAGIAELLAAARARVEVITRWAQPFMHLATTTELDFVLPRLKRLGVTISTRSYVRAIEDRCVVAYDVDVGSERVIRDVDAVVLVTARVADYPLEQELAGTVPQLFAVGDALAPRGLAEATYEGHRFARLIGEGGVPTSFAEAYWQEFAPDSFARPAAAPLETVEP